MASRLPSGSTLSGRESRPESGSLARRTDLPVATVQTLMTPFAPDATNDRPSGVKRNPATAPASILRRRAPLAPPQSEMVSLLRDTIKWPSGENATSSIALRSSFGDATSKRMIAPTGSAVG